MTKLIIAVVGGSLLLSVIFVFNSSSDKNSGKIETNPLEYDLGDISMALGPVTKTYEIKNNGETDLKIDKIWTSCHCTTAKLRVGDKESPEFGMSGNFPTWSESLAPNQTGYMDVTFDPGFHGPGGTGPMTRIIYITTSDPENQKVELKLMGNVTS